MADMVTGQWRGIHAFGPEPSFLDAGVQAPNQPRRFGIASYTDQHFSEFTGPCLNDGTKIMVKWSELYVYAD